VPVVLLGLGLLLVRALVAQLRQWQHVAAAAGRHLRDALGTDPLQAASSGRWRTAVLGAGSALTNTTVALAQFAVGALASAYLLFFLFRDGARFAGWLE